MAANLVEPFIYLVLPVFGSLHREGLFRMDGHTG
jgi:hypothetical protein